MAFYVETSTHGDVLVVTFSGESVATKQAWDKLFLEVDAIELVGKTVVNVEHVSRSKSEYVGALLSLVRRANAASLPIAVCNARQGFEEKLCTTRVDRLVAVCNDLREAIAELETGSSPS